MLVNVSYNKPELDRWINSEVGPPYSLLQRIKRKGIGSPKLWIHSASEEIDELLGRDSYNNTCNIELRPEGMILRFRSLLETYALILPYRNSDVRINREGQYQLSTQEHKVVISSRKETTKRYFNKLFAEQGELL